MTNNLYQQYNTLDKYYKQDFERLNENDKLYLLHKQMMPKFKEKLEKNNPGKSNSSIFANFKVHGFNTRFWARAIRRCSKYAMNFFESKI